MGRGFVLCSLADGSCSQYFRKLPEGFRQGSKRISFLFFKKKLLDVLWGIGREEAVEAWRGGMKDTEFSLSCFMTEFCLSQHWER